MSIEKSTTETKLDISELANLFTLYKDENGLDFFNIMKTVYVDSDIDNTMFVYYVTEPQDTYPLIAYKFYKDVRLWWVICATNQIQNPLPQPDAGTILKVLNAEYVAEILSKMSTSDDY